MGDGLCILSASVRVCVSRLRFVCRTQCGGKLDCVLGICQSNLAEVGWKLGGGGGCRTQCRGKFTVSHRRTQWIYLRTVSWTQTEARNTNTEMNLTHDGRLYFVENRQWKQITPFMFLDWWGGGGCTCLGMTVLVFSPSVIFVLGSV